MTKIFLDRTVSHVDANHLIAAVGLVDAVNLSEEVGCRVFQYQGAIIF